MVKIIMKENKIAINCSRCHTSKTMQSNFSLSDLDALCELCPSCFGDRLLSIIQDYQKAEGNFDCFGKSKGFCDQYNCKFRLICFKVGG